jgi:hypothetical protein
VALIGTQAMGVVKMGYGKRAIKAARFSPDAWVRLLVQLTYAARLLQRAPGWDIREYDDAPGFLRVARRWCASRARATRLRMR